MAKPELGTKRLCSSCGARFYDLHKDPIVCPKCATVFVPAPAPPTRSRPMERRPVEPAAAPLPKAELVSGDDASEEAEADEKLDDAGLIERDDEDQDVGAVIDDGPEKDEEA